MRSSSLTLAARYLFPVEGPPIADGRLTIAEGRIGWIGSARRAARPTSTWATWRSRPGFVNAHTHLELSALGDEAGSPRGRRGRGRLAPPGDRAASGRFGGRAPRGGRRGTWRRALAAGTTLAGRHDHGRPELGPGRRGARARRRLRRADRPERGRAASRPSEAAWDWLALGPPRVAGRRLRPARPRARTRPTARRAGSTTRRSASRLPLSTHLAEMPEELELLAHRDGPLRALPRRARRLGRRVGADRAPARRLRPPRRAAQRRLADRPRHLLRPVRVLAAPPRGRARRPSRRRRLLSADPRPVRPRPAPVSRHARTRRRRLPGDRQPGLQPEL